MANPGKTKRLFDRAIAELNAGNLPAAGNLAAKLVRADRKSFPGWRLKAVVHAELREFGPAERAFLAAARLAPSKPERGGVFEQLGVLWLQRGTPAGAAEYLQKATELDSGNANAAFCLAEARRLANDHDRALTDYTAAAALAGETADILMGMAECHSELGDFARAEAVLQRAIDVHSGDPKLHYQLALLYRDFGETDRAAEQFETTLALEPSATTVYYNYARTKTFRCDDAVIGRIRQQLAIVDAKRDGARRWREKSELLFALGKIAEDCREFDRAFAYWREANSLMRRTIEYDVEHDRIRAASVRSAFDGDRFDRLQLDAGGDTTPIFIVGLPRAGSTLCEQILASHTEIRGLGELTLLPRLLGRLEKRTGTPYPGVLARIDAGELRSLRDRYLAELKLPADTPYFTDKLPANFWLVGLIRLMFPTAKLVNARRNPADTALSCFKHLFGERQNFAYDATEIRQYIELHRELMTYWHTRLPDAMHDIQYEDLVSNPRGTISALLEYCGLPWQPGCLEFHKTCRAVRSSSAAQVRKPLHGDAVDLWRHYESHLQEFASL